MKAAQAWLKQWPAFVNKRHKGWKIVRYTDITDAQVEYIKLIQKDAKK